MDMFYKARLRDFFILEPRLIQSDDPLNSCLGYLKENYEETVIPEVGLIIKVLEINDISDGIIIPREGLSQHIVEFTVIAFLPELNEIIEGECTEFTPRLARVQIGSVSAMCPMDKITPEGGIYLKKRPVVISRDKKYQLNIREHVRVQIVSVNLKSSLNRMMSVSMKKSGLGSFSWFREKPKEGEINEEKK